MSAGGCIGWIMSPSGRGAGAWPGECRRGARVLHWPRLVALPASHAVTQPNSRRSDGPSFAFLDRGCLRGGLRHLGLHLPGHPLGRGRDPAVHHGRGPVPGGRARLRRVGGAPGRGAADRPRLGHDRVHRPADGGRRQRAGQLGAATRAVRDRGAAGGDGAAVGGPGRLAAAGRRAPGGPRGARAGTRLHRRRAARQSRRHRGSAGIRYRRRGHDHLRQPAVGVRLDLRTLRPAAGVAGAVVRHADAGRRHRPGRPVGGVRRAGRTGLAGRVPRRVRRLGLRRRARVGGLRQLPVAAEGGAAGQGRHLCLREPGHRVAPGLPPGGRGVVALGAGCSAVIVAGVLLVVSR